MNYRGGSDAQGDRRESMRGHMIKIERPGKHVGPHLHDIFGYILAEKASIHAVHDGLLQLLLWRLRVHQVRDLFHILRAENKCK